MSLELFGDIPLLDKNKLRSILSSRFSMGEKKLSQIPPPTLLKDASKASKKIAKYIQNGKKIAVVGDYDVDGICSTAIVVDFFKELGYPLQAIIPNRFSDGYGLSPSVLDRLEADLVLTVDNGIGAIEAAKVCKERGITLIISDHHTPLENLPDAYAIVDPKLDECNYPLSEICGAQVAWLLLAELKKELGAKVDMSKYLDLLSIAIIADIMPLIDINRAIVKEGLKRLSSSSRPYAIIIRNSLNKTSISSEDIAFMIAPKLNSAGRMADASLALEFLSTTSTAKAYEIFMKLNSLNDERKAIEAGITKEAIALCDPNDEIIVVASELWHDGVVGIVASKLVDHFNKPAIVLCIKKDEAKGSARSVAGVDLHSLIAECEDLLLGFGGHKLAAGLTLLSQNIDLFRSAINKRAKEQKILSYIYNEKPLGILPSCEIDFELLEILEEYEPYGEANKRPLFFMQEAKIKKVEAFGRDKNHSKVIVEQKNSKESVELVLFKNIINSANNNTLSCSYRVLRNEFNSKVSVQLIINKLYI